MQRAGMNNFLALAVSVISLTLSRAKEIDSSYQCKGSFEYNATTKGEVTSPFYNERDTYHDGLNCEYKIRAPEGNRIKISFKAFDIAPSGSCAQDQLVVYSKFKKASRFVFCGTEIPKPIISLPGENEIQLLFKTDYMVSGKGFVLEYEFGPNLEICATGLKECKNRNCYDPKKKCDGEDDCGDGTDEENCGFPLVVKPELCGTPIFEPNLGLSQSSPDRMVGGDIAIPNSWPWQVSLQNRYIEPNGHFCGGTLINAQWVVTAGHCVTNYPISKKLKIVLGSHHKYKSTKYQQIRYAAKIISYSDLEGENLKKYDKRHDVSLIKLNAPVKFNSGVQPACLPPLGRTAKPGMLCYVTGWGETRGTGGSDVLKQQQQIVQDPKTCMTNDRAQICLEKFQQSPCHGDSGSPLHCKQGAKWFVYGAASYVSSSNRLKGLCTGPGARSVYANLGDKMHWISTLVNQFS